MLPKFDTIGLFVASPSFASILSMTLASARHLRIRSFDSEQALLTYARLAPMAVVVVDFDNGEAPPDGLARALRDDPGIDPALQIMALAGDVDRRLQSAAFAAGIDEIVLKPMSPRYLLERVLSRLARRRLRRDPPPPRPDWSAHGDNIVPLFGRDPVR